MIIDYHCRQSCLRKCLTSRDFFLILPDSVTLTTCISWAYQKREKKARKKKREKKTDKALPLYLLTTVLMMCKEECHPQDGGCKKGVLPRLERGASRTFT